MKAGWEVKPLGEVCKVDWGNTDLTKKAFVEDGEFLGVSAAGCDGRMSHAEHKRHTPVLSAIGAQCGRMFLPEEDFTAIKNTITLTPYEDRCGPVFLYYLLTLIDLPKRGAGQPFISKGDIQKFTVNVPPVDEQKRIVAVLDAAFEGLTRARTHIETNLQNARELFAAQRKHLLSRDARDWKNLTVDQICIVERGSSPRPIKKYVTQNSDGVNWIKIGDTKVGSKYVSLTKEKITPAGAEKSRRVETGDFILTNSMTYGRPYIMATDGYIHDGWFVLRLKEEINSDYLFHALSSEVIQEQFRSLAAGAVVKNISGDLVKKAIVPIPPIGVQVTLARKMDAASGQVEDLQSHYRAKLQDLDDLRQSLLQKAFAGELT